MKMKNNSFFSFDLVLYYLLRLDKMNKRYNPDILVGLSKEQVSRRMNDKLVNFDNVLPTKSYKQIVYSNIFTLFNIINLILGLLIVTTGTFKNLPFLGVALCNTIISMVQEMRSKHTIDKLAIISSTKVNVVRESEDVLVGVNDIVLDDIVKWKLGNQIVVDCIIKEGIVEVDESFLTGESDHILKSAGDKLLSGSFIVSGNCTSQVDSVGEECYANKISKEAKYLKKVNSEIMMTLNKIIKFISIVIIPLGIILFIHQFSITGEKNEAIVSTVAAIIGTIPEGLVLLTSTVLAISSIRLARRNVLVQELFCIENLARVDTICLDKTGTLTTGKLHVHQTISLDSRYDMKMIMQNISFHMTDGNSTSLAINNAFEGIDNLHLKNKIAFSSSKKYSVYEFEHETYIVGAPEFIPYYGVIKDLDKYLSNYRVLLVGASKEKIVNNEVKGSFKAIGLILIEDEIRACAKETLNYLKSQDVDIKLISGDNVKTVGKIATLVGLDDIRLFDMHSLKNTDDLTEIVKQYNVFGRVTPTEKRELVIALKKAGHKVAMTGDGVNDVLSLKEADCSIALASGSDAARNVSEVVLLDSDFEAIPAIVKEGRRTINNLERSASLFLTKTIYSIILAIMFVFINMDYPFIPIQLSLISVINIGIPSFILALEPNHNRVKGRFLTNVISKSIPAALTIVINIITVMVISYLLKVDEDYISTMSVILVAFTGFVLLFKVCYPFNYLRGALYGTLVGIFIGSAIGLSRLFELVLLTPFQFIFIAGLCILDIIIFRLLTQLCERKIFKYQERIVK